MRGHLDLLGLLLLLKYCICDDVLDFDEDIKDLVVGKSKLFVLTDHQLYQMRHDLYEEKRKDITNGAQNRVNILVPFEANGTLITCGTLKYCEVLHINDITNRIYYKSLLLGARKNEKSVAFIVDTSSDRFLLVGKKDERLYPQDSSYPVVYLLNTLDSQSGGIFSKIGEGINAFIKSSVSDVEFIDGFQRVSPSELYLFLNTKTDSERKVIVLKMDSSYRKKDQIIRSLQSSRIQCCGDKVRPVLVASAVISTEKNVIWAGVFSGQNQQDPENTALVLYDISHVQGRVKGFCPNGESPCGFESGSDLQPLSVLFKFSSMSSVAAVRNGVWTVLFVGTSDGQLIKLVMDETFKPSCSSVLYKSDDERAVFPRMHFDPVDSKHIYIALRKQLRRVPVVQCNKHKTLRDCRAALDPLCGWCVYTQRCSTQDECPKASWVSFPKAFIGTQMFSFQTSEEFSKITLHLVLGLKSTGNPSFSCIFTTGSVKLCDGSDLTAVFPNCDCTFSDQLLKTRGLKVSAVLTIDDQKITETLTLRNCSSITDNPPHVSYTQCVQCISSGCHWSSFSQSCEWTHGHEPQLHIQDSCKDLFSQYKKPEILSLEPNKVSFHGRNDVLLRGRNLEPVTKIRIQGDLDCIPSESPVISRSSDSLKFHIPPSETKGTVKVCVVTPDDRCHGISIITYISQPICTGIQPRVSWSSGGRKIHVQGSNMDLVESFILHPTNKVLKTQYNTSSGDMWFHSPHYDGSGLFRLLLNVGNSTVNSENYFSYQPDPKFIQFSTFQLGNNLLVIIQKKEDELNLSVSEVKVTALQGDQEYQCVLEKIEPNAVFCRINGEPGAMPAVDSLNIRVGNSYVLRMGENTINFCLHQQNSYGQKN